MNKKNNFDELKIKIEQKTARVGVMGLGYVGESLARGIAAGGFETIGFEIDPKKLESINAKNIPNITASVEVKKIVSCDIICICVPTPLNEDNSVNLEFIKIAAEQIRQHLHSGQLIVVESSVSVGTTREVVAENLDQSGEEYFLGMSPERIDPGNEKYNLNNTPKIVSGVDDYSLQLMVKFYSQFVVEVVAVNSLESAEMTKILENTFRQVNISLINEFADYAKARGVDIQEVVKAAATKPFGFMAHYPGIGAGGYCIPVLPYFALEDAKKKQVNLAVINAAVSVNENRPKQIIQEIKQLIKKQGKGNDTKVLFVGIGYKPNSAEIRNSAAVKVFKFAEKSGFKVSYHDPYVEEFENKKSVPLSEVSLDTTDILVLTTAHKNINYQKLLKLNIPIIDACFALTKLKL